MHLRVICIGSRMPPWIKTGFEEYARRMPQEMPLSLHEIPAPKHRGDGRKSQQLEAERLLKLIQTGDYVIALDERGESMSSAGLAKEMSFWRSAGRNVVFVVGGADGLADSVLTRADRRLSLSALTYPHYMVRVILAEALYRAWSIVSGYPYHRE